MKKKGEVYECPKCGSQNWKTSSAIQNPLLFKTSTYPAIYGMECIDCGYSGTFLIKDKDAKKGAKKVIK